MTDQKTEKLEPASTSVEQKALASADAQQARNADAAQVAQVQNTNPDKHSGSAGGDDPYQSIEVVGLDYVISRDSKLTGKDVAEIEARRKSITKDELKEKAQAGDGQARDLLSYFADAEKIPPGPARDKALSVQQTNADRIFGRGEFANRKILPEGSEPKKLSDTAVELQTRAMDNPALAPVAGLRAYADKLPDGEEKDRLMHLAKQQAAEYVPEIAERYEQNGQLVEVSVSGQVLPQSQAPEGNEETTRHAPEQLSNTPDDWLKVAQKISALPFDQQVQVLGSGLLAGAEQYQQEQKQRAWGSLIGTVQGVGHVAENLAKIADFGAALILNDKQKAGKLAEEFGASVGQTIVGGVQLFRASEQYFSDVGETGDYAKPFRDVVAVGIVLNEEWSKKTPFEQERIKSELIAELLADGVVGTHGAGAIKKCTKFTEILDTIAKHADEGSVLAKTFSTKADQIADVTDVVVGHGEKIHAKAKSHLEGAVKSIQNAIDKLIPVMGDTGTGFKIPIPSDGHRISDKVGSAIEEYSMKMAPFYQEGSKKPISIKKAAEIAGVSRKEVVELSEKELAKMGLEYIPQKYADAFFEANKHLAKYKDQLQVHHRIPQTVLDKAICKIGTFTAKEINGLKNLVAVPESALTYSPATGEIVRVHSAITTEWGYFLAKNEGTLTRRKVLDFARRIDSEYGHFYKR